MEYPLRLAASAVPDAPSTGWVVFHLDPGGHLSAYVQDDHRQVSANDQVLARDQLVAFTSRGAEAEYVRLSGKDYVTCLTLTPNRRFVYVETAWHRKFYAPQGTGIASTAKDGLDMLLSTLQGTTTERQKFVAETVTMVASDMCMLSLEERVPEIFNLVDANGFYEDIDAIAHQIALDEGRAFHGEVTESAPGVHLLHTRRLENPDSFNVRYADGEIQLLHVAYPPSYPMRILAPHQCGPVTIVPFRAGLDPYATWEPVRVNRPVPLYLVAAR